MDSFRGRGGSRVVRTTSMEAFFIGIQVARLFDGELSAGERSFTWDAHGTPPGTYLCVVRSCGSQEHVPMVVVR